MVPHTHELMNERKIPESSSTDIPSFLSTKLPGSRNKLSSAFNRAMLFPF